MSAPQRGPQAQPGTDLRGILRRDAFRSPDHGVDAAMTALLVLVAATSLDGTFAGWGYLMAAALGVAVAVVAVAVGRRLGSTALALVLAVIGFVLLTPLVALRGAPSGPWPLPATWRELGGVVVGGWKDLLTTMPPVASDGRLVALVTVITLVGSLLALVTALMTRSRLAPLVGPLGVLAAGAVLGVQSPAGIATRGVLLALGTVVWAGLRERRTRTSSGEPLSRLATGAAVLAVAGLVTGLLAPIVVDAGAHRSGLRGRVSAPTTIADPTSPLAAFRRFTPAHHQLADAALLHVDGLPDAVPVRLAVLDDYSGTVWSGGPADGTGGGYVRVGARLPAPMPGRTVRATMTVEPALATAPGLRSWLPTVGQPTSLRFTGADAWTRDDAVRYDPMAGAAVITGGLRAGDRYTVSGVVPDAARPPAVGAVPQPAVPGPDAAITSRLVAASGAKGSDRMALVLAVADRLRRTGAYTDGIGPEARFTAGHSVGRLTAFLDDPQPAGDDEQFSAALALAAAQIGLPARVVLLGTPHAGTVRGRDVRAAVEVQTGPDAWYTLTADRFVPPTTKKPALRRDQQQDLTERAIVPPPNAQRPPSSTDQLVVDSTSSARGRTPVAPEEHGLPTWARVLLLVLLVPLALAALWTGLVLGTKAIRRWRRRSGDPASAVDGAWRELVDDLRDHGIATPRGQTRGALARAVALPSVVQLARQVDALLFGPQAPTADDATRTWERLGAVRAELRHDRTPVERVRTALSLRSLRPARAAAADAAPSYRYRALLAPTPVTGETRAPRRG